MPTTDIHNVKVAPEQPPKELSGKAEKIQINFGNTYQHLKKPKNYRKNSSLRINEHKWAC